MAIKSKKVKITARERSKRRIRKRIVGVAERPRITVFKSGKHIYAQVIQDVDGVTLASASTKDKEVIEQLSAAGEKSASTKSLQAAKVVGMTIAKKAQATGVSSVVFDRNGYVYHGRVQAVAEGAREGGLKF